LAIHGREEIAGDLVFHLHLADDGKAFGVLAAELRARSQQEKKSVFWAIALGDAIDRETVELFRSKEMLARKEREAKGEDVLPLIGEERVRLRRHQDELRRLIKAACLAGSVYFRGNDRSPNDRAVDVGKSASEILAEVLPDVFDRFKEAGARSGDLKKALDALFVADNLQGLPSVFTQLRLLRDEKGKTVFAVDAGPLAEVMSRIEQRTNYGETASGRLLAEDLGREPFGWDFEAVRLFVLSLLRAGAIEAMSKGQTIDAATGLDAKETFSNNNLFRQASFRPKKGPDFVEVAKAGEAFKDTFGRDVKELTSGTIVADLRKEIARHVETVTTVLGHLTGERLPGAALLEGAVGQMKAILGGSEDNAIGTFNASHRSIKDAVKRASELEHALTAPHLRDLARARLALSLAIPFLRQEPDLGADVGAKTDALENLLARETFFRELPVIEQQVTAIEAEYDRRFQAAMTERCDVYGKAFDRLVKTPGWSAIDEDEQHRIAAPLERGMKPGTERPPIPQLRSDRDACDTRLRGAVAEVRRIVEGERLVTVNLGGYFGGGVETEEQLDAAIDGIREECARLIGAGKKVVAQ